MKRFMILAMLTVVMSSCALQRATTSCRSFASQTLSEIPVVADLEVGEKISYTYRPETSMRKRLSKQELIDNAVAEALRENGNADVLLQPQFVFYYVEAQKYRRVTVTGFPAKYVDFRTPTDEDFNNLQRMASLPKIKNDGALKGFISKRNRK